MNPPNHLEGETQNAVYINSTDRRVKHTEDAVAM